MTNEQAIEHLRGWLKEHYALDETDREVLRMAIRSLEAWQEVRGEINELIDWHFTHNQEAVAQMFSEALEIVDKHLKEVEGYGTNDKM